MTQYFSNPPKADENILDFFNKYVFVFPTSFAQQRLWFLQQLLPNNPLYNLPTVIQLRGRLDVSILKHSFNTIMQRHEVLRTTFTTADEKPVQVITPALNLTLPMVDLQQLPEHEREDEARRLASEEFQRPFDLAHDILLRVTLLRLEDQNHMLLLTMHHIVSDGWSMGIFIQEMATLYKAFVSNQPSPLPKLPIQYADFAHWQRQWLTGDVLKNQLAYWKQKLAALPPALELPTDRSRPAKQSFRGSYQVFQVNCDLTQKLKALAQRSGATLFMLLLTAFKILLYRYTQQTDIVVGSAIANRNRLEIEGLIGFFVNTLVLRTDLLGNPSFLELLNRVRQVALEAYAHQDLPLEKLVEELQPERNLSHSPLFQVMFVLQNAPSVNLELSGLTLNYLPSETQTAKFDLTLSMTETEQGLRGSLEYNTDLFNADTITRIAGNFQTLLESIVANPTQLLSDLPLTTATEQHQLLVEWNNTQTNYPKQQCIHQLFEAQVERTPDAVAVVFENEHLTYRKLNAKANQLAHHLRTLGVEPETRVGICMERSLVMVVGLLGILKVGGAYVPLNPTYPQERLAFMLEDAQVSLLLTTEKVQACLPENQVHLVCLDTEWKIISRESEENLISRVEPQNLAYVIYTSGSTGRAKGVAMIHSSLFNLIFWHLHQDVADSNPARTLQFAPISFDVSFQEIFSTWGSGGTLVLLSEEMRRDAVAFLRFLEEEAVEKLFLPFVALQQLAELADSFGSVPKSLREFISSGEQLRITPHITSLFTKLIGSTLHNHYGPSENHLVTNFTLSGSVSNWPTLPPIGHPIANNQIYLLDQYLKSVPIGVPGELYIGGASLARGYFNRPELTAEKFIPNPFSHKPGTRLYKTGDLACYLADGNIKFLGRLDDQLKIRGFRIELGEVEATLNQHPAVRKTVVINREDMSGNKYLVAYVVPDRGLAPKINELRNFLEQKLPNYMIPSSFILLESLPLTLSGKVDRHRLPQPDRSHPNLEEDFVAPRTHTEEILAVIWAKVLKLEQVGVCDNFFDLGGHSLLATQIISQVRQAFQVDLPLYTLFEAPTVADLSECIETIRWAAQTSNILPGDTTGETGNYREGEL